MIREPAPWREPVRGGFVDPATAGLSGLEQLQSGMPNPPMSRLTGLRFDEAAPETATFSFPISGWLAWTGAAVPGGVAAIPGDAAVGCALQACLPAGRSYTTAELSLTYIRPLRVGTGVVARGQALHAGRALGLATADLIDDHGRLLAHATSRCQIFDVEGAHTKGGTAPPPRPAYPENADGSPDPYLWPLPLSGAREEEQHLSGLESLRALVRGDSPAPPLHHLLGIAPVDCAEGKAACAMPMSGWLATPYGWPQGGFIALLADVALAFAVQTTCTTDEALESVDLKVNFVRPVACDGSLLTAQAHVVHRGRTLAVADAEIVDSEGKRVAVATGSSRLLAATRA